LVRHPIVPSLGGWRCEDLRFVDIEARNWHCAWSGQPSHRHTRLTVLFDVDTEKLAQDCVLRIVAMSKDFLSFYKNIAGALRHLFCFALRARFMVHDQLDDGQ